MTPGDYLRINLAHGEDWAERHLPRSVRHMALAYGLAGDNGDTAIDLKGGKEDE